MESVINSNKLTKNNRVSLKDFYHSLPSSSHPKTDFINEVLKRTGVSVTTVRNWILYGMKPNDVKHIEVLSDITGIPVCDLWND